MTTTATELDDSDVATHGWSWADLLHALRHRVDVDPRNRAVSDNLMQANSGRGLKRRPTIARYLACVPELRFMRLRTISGSPPQTTPAPHR